MSNNELNLLFHEVTDQLDASGFKRASATPYKHSTALFNDYLNVLKKSVQPKGIFSQPNSH